MQRNLPAAQGGEGGILCKEWRLSRQVDFSHEKWGISLLDQLWGKSHTHTRYFLNDAFPSRVHQTFMLLLRSFFVQLFTFHERNIMRITLTGTRMWSFLPKRPRLLARCSPHSCFPPLLAGLSYVAFVWNLRDLKFPSLQCVRAKSFHDCHFPRRFRGTRHAIRGQKTKCHANVFICVAAFRKQRES